MIDYFILGLLLCTMFCCNTLFHQLKRLDFGYKQVISMINQLNFVVVSARKDAKEISKVLIENYYRSKSAIESSEEKIEDLKFMGSRAEKIIEKLYDIIESDREIRKSDNEYNFKELLLRIAK